MVESMCSAPLKPDVGPYPELSVRFLLVDSTDRRNGLEKSFSLRFVGTRHASGVLIEMLAQDPAISRI